MNKNKEYCKYRGSSKSSTSLGEDTALFLALAVSVIISYINAVVGIISALFFIALYLKNDSPKEVKHEQRRKDS